MLAQLSVASGWHLRGRCGMQVNLCAVVLLGCRAMPLCPAMPLHRNNKPTDELQI